MVKLINYQLEAVTNCAKIVPVKIENNGKTQSLWVVTEFLEDTYFEGDIIEIKEKGSKIRDLLIHKTDLS